MKNENGEMKINTDTKSQADTGNIRFMPFFVKSLAWCGITFLMIAHFAGSHFWVVVLSVFLFGVPIALPESMPAPFGRFEGCRYFPAGAAFQVVFGPPPESGLLGLLGAVLLLFYTGSVSYLEQIGIGTLFSCGSGLLVCF